MGIVRDIEIRWAAGSELDNVVTGTRSLTGRARISILPDQQVLEKVLSDLALSGDGEVFAYRPFDSDILMSAVLTRL